MKKVSWKLLIICLVIVYSVALLGSLFTDTTGWYDSVKPSITPPNYVFPIVWNILFFLIALSLYLSWTNAKNKKIKKRIVGVFALNLLLNLLWSIVFFGIKNSTLAFIELIFLWLSIALMIFITYKSSKTSAYILIPYFLWVSFAGVLNYLIAF